MRHEARVALVWLALGCGGATPVAPVAPVAPSEMQSAGQASARPEAAPWSRAEWLRAVDGFVAEPATVPRLSDPATRPVFEKLVSTRAWLELDAAVFVTSGAELVRFFPAVKQLVGVLPLDETVALGIYQLEVYRAFIGAGSSYVASLPATDSTREARLRGLGRVQLSAAIAVCALLYLAMDASEPLRVAALSRLGDAPLYDQHTREGLQLILATLDERILPAIAPRLAPRYRAVRATIARLHASRGAGTSSTRTTYQGLGPPNLQLTAAVVSVTGGFAVDAGPGGIAKLVETTHANGSIWRQHWIRRFESEVESMAICADGVSVANLTAAVQARGGVRRATSNPGVWFTVATRGRTSHLRVLEIGGRGCFASVEGPDGQVPQADADAFLMSLRPAP